MGKLVVFIPDEYWERLNERADTNCRMVEEEGRAIIQQVLDVRPSPNPPASLPGTCPHLAALRVSLDNWDACWVRLRDLAEGPQKGRKRIPENPTAYACALASIGAIRRTLQLIDALAKIPEGSVL